MKLNFKSLLASSGLALLCAFPGFAQISPSVTTEAEKDATAQEQADTQVIDEVRVLDTAQKQGKQALGSSIITAEDIQRRPPINDLSDIIRREPGINLTNSGSGGTYGNNRQIDIRGMGPENTFILVDGKPVQSRNSVRMGRDGERNSRGDTNWVPAEEVERIEILRGPAAARYGSGAAGGVVNIITKGPATELRGSLTGFVQQPEDGLESESRRIGASLAGPIADWLSFRVYGNYNKTGGDDPLLNAEAANTAPGVQPPAGREGVTNKDVNGLLRFIPAQGQRIDLEGSFSRQGNEFVGEVRLAPNAAVVAALGDETNVIKRSAASINYQGDFSAGTAKLIAQYEHTNNRRLNEGLAGSGEGSFTSATAFSEAELENWYVNGSWDAPFSVGALTSVLTVGGEYRHEYLNDPYAVTQGIGNGQAIPGADSGARRTDASAETVAGFVENNAIYGPATLTTGVRYDHHSLFGDNWSPSVALAIVPVANLTIKGGIARAFKAPNLYQSNPNYLYFTMGNGCPLAFGNNANFAGCYVQGNTDLEAERSWNKEIGVAYAPTGWNFSATYFHNDYSNKIIANNVPVGNTVGGTGLRGRIFQWFNAPKAIVEGVEGNVLVPLHRTLNWSTNGTYMIQNENKTTGETLSVIPEYTINSFLTWTPVTNLDVQLNYTRYGKQEPNRALYSGAVPTLAQLRPRAPYDLVALTATIRPTRSMRLGVGVYNLFDERLFRESSNAGQGANNYNEPGRSFFVTSTVSF